MKIKFDIEDGENYVSINSILERLRKARVSKGHEDCYWNIEQDLEGSL